MYVYMFVCICIRLSKIKTSDIWYISELDYLSNMSEAKGSNHSNTKINKAFNNTKLFLQYMKWEL